MSGASEIWTKNFSSRHLQLSQKEKIPFEKGHVLGQGGVSTVYETKMGGIALAWKRTYTRVIGETQLNEMKILREMRRHQHIVELVGSYIRHGKTGGFHEVGLLIWPVAHCDFRIFLLELDKLRALVATNTLIELEDEEERTCQFLATLIPHQERFPKSPAEVYNAVIKRLCTAFGCIAHAIEYLHSNKVRHRDLKPDQILISRDGLWLTDFGWSKDVSNLSTSTSANGEVINRKYHSPERAQMQPAGRSEDIFSLGCIFLQMAYGVAQIPLQLLEELRGNGDKSFQANLGNVDKWIYQLRKGDSMKLRFLAAIVKDTLSKQPKDRPGAEEIIAVLKAIDALPIESDALVRCSFVHSCCSASRTMSSSSQSTKMRERSILKDKVEGFSDLSQLLYMIADNSLVRDYARAVSEAADKMLAERRHGLSISGGTAITSVERSSHGLSGNYTPKKWDTLYSTNRIPREPESYVNCKRSLKASQTGSITLFFNDQDDDQPFGKFQEVKQLCQYANLQDVALGLGAAGQRRVAWVDDRSIVLEENDGVSGGHVRKCQNPLTATGLLRHLSTPRFNNTQLPDADRRLIYIPNLDPNFIIALVETAPYHQVPALRDALRQYLAFETSMRVKAPPIGYPVFRMQLHIPFFVLTTCPMPTPCDRTIPAGQWVDISFLNGQTLNPVPGPKTIYKSRFSLMICGSDNQRWIAYAFEDRDSEDEAIEEDDCSYEVIQEDSIIADGTDANLPIWDPREYFLLTVERRGKNILEKWETLISAVESRINDYRSRHPDFFSPYLGIRGNGSTKHEKETFGWALRVVTLLSHLLEVLTRTIQTWERFRDPENGDIGYFYDSASLGSPNTKSESSGRFVQSTLGKIRDTFETLEERQRILQSLKQSCDDSIKLKYKVSVASQPGFHMEFHEINTYDSVEPDILHT
ncbi:kinase-like protein [Lophium mytilinum]|uniref:non-specific serine/threonine protein kinase n=1 Tax=Lophium mytilinum TaxID=390894 RepID=A0A6A6QNX3_9PEZI|nr:kinase-like protein [Lophium mytilinum]